MNNNEFEFLDDYEDDYDYDGYIAYPQTYMQLVALLDKTALKDKLTVISFYIATFECFKVQIINDIKSVYCLPDSKSTLEKIHYEITDAYKKNILDTVVGQNKTGWKDPLKATMRWLLNERAISQEDYNAFIKLRELRNSYVHEMVSYILETGKITVDNYNSLKTLLTLFKKIEIWFIKNIEAPRSWPDELLKKDIKDEDICNPLIALLEMMADSLDLASFNI